MSSGPVAFRVSASDITISPGLATLVEVVCFTTYVILNNVSHILKIYLYEVKKRISINLISKKKTD